MHFNDVPGRNIILILHLSAENWKLIATAVATAKATETATVTGTCNMQRSAAIAIVGLMSSKMRRTTKVLKVQGQEMQFPDLPECQPRHFGGPSANVDFVRLAS